MKQKLFKELYYQSLKLQFNNLSESQVLKEYTKPKFAIPDGSLIETDIVVNEHLALDPPNGRESNDLKNAISVFETFSNLTPAEATDAKLWVTLAHNECWEYMRKRWPVEETTAKNKVNYIAQRYFIKGVNTNNLLRHGISRLWWTVYLTKDETLENPYELTEEVFSMLDYTTHLLPGTQGRNRELSRAVLSFVLKNEDIFASFKESRVRFLMRRLNHIAGYKVVSALNQNEIMKIIQSFKSDLLQVKD